MLLWLTPWCRVEVNWIICSSQFYLYLNVLKVFWWVFFSTFPLFISLSPWRISRRICFKWADNTLFKIYKYDRIISFFLTAPEYANKLGLNYLSLAFHRINIGKEHLIRVYLKQNFNRSSETTNKTGAIVPTRKPDAIARVFFSRDHSTLAASFDTCCHSSSFKDKCGPDRAWKTCESMRVLHPEEMGDWDVVLKASWRFLTTYRTFSFLFFLLFFLSKSVLRTSAKSGRAGLCSVLSKSLVPGI